MSKVSKLLKNPRAFWKDASFVRRWNGEVSAPVPPPQSRSVAESELLRELAAALPLVDTSAARHAGIQLGILASDRPKLAAYLVRRAAERNQTIVVGHKRAAATLPAARIFEIEELMVFGTSVYVDFVALAPVGTLRVTVHFWETLGDAQVFSPAPNPWARRISLHTVRARGLFQPGPLVHVSQVHAHSVAEMVSFPIDVVYTWVDHEDAAWRAQYQAAVGKAPDEQEQDDARGLERYVNRGELKYSLRSVASFAPWARRIFIVSNCRPPAWLDTMHPKIQWVDHSEIFPADALPTFNSHAIESRLHHIPGLGDEFLYFNDDFFLLRPTAPEDFFQGNGVSRSVIEDYGSVNGEISATDPDYLNAARNGQRLLEEFFGRSPAALHRHAPYALRKDVLAEIEEAFREPLAKTTRSRFRSREDISLVSFLYHHYAYLTGRATYATARVVLVKPHNPGYQRILRELLRGSDKPVSVCLNDGAGSTQIESWAHCVESFLAATFPEPCEFERRAHGIAPR